MGQPTAHMHLASMNIEMDEKAKAAIQAGYQGSIQYWIPGEGWCYYINKERITKHLMNKLQNHINSITIQKYWGKQKRYGRGNTTMIEWDIAKKAI